MDGAVTPLHVHSGAGHAADYAQSLETSDNTCVLALKSIGLRFPEARPPGSSAPMMSSVSNDVTSTEHDRQLRTKASGGVSSNR